MKLTKEALREIIREELLNEGLRKKWTVHHEVNGGEYESYTEIWADSVTKTGKMKIDADGVTVDFREKILKIT